jgi:hypothetical protein
MYQMAIKEQQCSRAKNKNAQRANMALISGSSTQIKHVHVVQSARIVSGKSNSPFNVDISEFQLLLYGMNFV